MIRSVIFRFHRRNAAVYRDSRGRLRVLDRFPGGGRLSKQPYREIQHVVRPVLGHCKQSIIDAYKRCMSVQSHITKSIRFCRLHKNLLITTSVEITSRFSFSTFAEMFENQGSESKSFCLMDESITSKWGKMSTDELKSLKPIKNRSE